MTKKGGVGIIILIIFLILIIVGAAMFLVLKYIEPQQVKYGKMAVKENDMSICLELRDSQKAFPTDCWRYAAGQGKPIDLCISIDSDTQKFNCIYAFIQIKLNIDECSLLSGQEKGFCIRSLAIINRDPQLCEQITDPEEKNMCEGDLFIEFIPYDVNCADSDGGITTDEVGIVYDKTDFVVYTDQCLGTSLIEHYCENDRHEQEIIDCGCIDDVCP
jgi:hypothetical protein